MAEQFEERMAGASGFAALIFILSTIFVAFSSESTDILLSLPAIVFLLVGSITAMFFVGIPYYVIQKDLAQLLYRVLKYNNSVMMSWVARSLGTGLMVTQILLIYYATKAVFRWYFA